MQIHVTDRDGAQHVLHPPVGAVLMEVLRDAEMDVEAVCGGCCSCATCHVLVDSGARGQRGEIEAELLSASPHFDPRYSRLSCQITIAPAHADLRVRIAPEE